MLMGFVSEDAEGFVVAAKNVVGTYGWNLYNGAFMTRFLGIRKKRRVFEIKSEAPDIATETALASLGRLAMLESVPEEQACLYVPLVSNPYLLTADVEGNTVTLSFYTGRAFFAFLRANNVFFKFFRAFPEGTVTESGAFRRPGRKQKSKKNGFDASGTENDSEIETEGTTPSEKTSGQEENKENIGITPDSAFDDPEDDRIEI